LGFGLWFGVYGLGLGFVVSGLERGLRLLRTAIRYYLILNLVLRELILVMREHIPSDQIK
jgi:hypothetical protein